ncbi:hypothetical protein GOV05_00765 [Candidatus Woesearchaeota archaeon]|nr:hypothetical protein [Candidatus Woesearchaeota archaeon]
MVEFFDLVSRIEREEEQVGAGNLRSVSPDDAKYWKDTKDLAFYLSAHAEWMACAWVQKVLLETRVEFGQAKKENLEELEDALTDISPANMNLLEADPRIRHDQLAVLEEIGRFVSEETKALLHPGTTSYDILDTARSYLLKEAYPNVFRPAVGEVINKLCDLSEEHIDLLQVGRTHLNHTSPVPFGTTLAISAARLAERLEKADAAFGDLRGKISGIVGTGASIEQVIGNGRSRDFEFRVLEKLGLKPDTTATQIVQKERLADTGNSIVTLMHVLGDFANDMRILYSSDINEVTSRSGAKRLGGSSADASKNNPINWENIAGKTTVVESGMRVLYEMISSDLQRDLRSSVQARYQPQLMMVETYESFNRASKALDNLSVNEDVMARNLRKVNEFPSEAMVAILRGYAYVHPEYGVGHSFVKEISKLAKEDNDRLMSVALRDDHFHDFFYNEISNEHRNILSGGIENYVGSAKVDAKKNAMYARGVASKESLI